MMIYYLEVSSDAQESRKVRQSHPTNRLRYGKWPDYDKCSRLHKLLEADVIFGLSKTWHYYLNVSPTANEATQRMIIKATSKENDYSKQCVNYFQSWHMGTTNKLLQTALQK